MPISFMIDKEHTTDKSHSLNGADWELCERQVWTEIVENEGLYIENMLERKSR